MSGLKLTKKLMILILLLLLCVGGISGCGSDKDYIIRDPDPLGQIIDKDKETLVLPHWEWVGCRCSEGVVCMKEQDFILFTQFMIAAETVLLKHNVQIKYLLPLSQ